MLTSIFKGLGGLVGDTAEGLKYLAEEIQEIPKALEEGYKEGLMITPEGQEPTQNKMTIAEAMEIINKMKEEETK